jgi:hypothetical protein
MTTLTRGRASTAVRSQAEPGNEESFQPKVILPLQRYHRATRPPLPPLTKGGRNARLRLDYATTSGIGFVPGFVSGIGRAPT